MAAIAHKLVRKSVAVVLVLAVCLSSRSHAQTQDMMMQGLPSFEEAITNATLLNPNLTMSMDGDMLDPGMFPEMPLTAGKRKLLQLAWQSDPEWDEFWQVVEERTSQEPPSEEEEVTVHIRKIFV